MLNSVKICVLTCSEVLGEDDGGDIDEEDFEVAIEGKPIQPGFVGVTSMDVFSGTMSMDNEPLASSNGKNCDTTSSPTSTTTPPPATMTNHPQPIILRNSTAKQHQKSSAVHNNNGYGNIKSSSFKRAAEYRVSGNNTVAAKVN